ncbi:MAG: lytic transglycosylase domain-containing protein [Candidatus Eremiobacteraeota bacterium]|nr:lytic transglycosylase domain-containing protein [Candidatus Eremiobacteraeota bacterium]
MNIPRAINVALSWQAPARTNAFDGLRLLRDGPPTRDITLALTRAILRTNPRITPVDALYLARLSVTAAQRNDIDAAFFGATLLQESAFDPRAFSAAGAIGIAQFEYETAEGIGVDPFDPASAIEGAARLLASYRQQYSTRPNPYALALAAYNAGPGSVEYYGGIPPYAETRDYIDTIFERWSKIVVYERGTGRAHRRRIERS